MKNKPIHVLGIDIGGTKTALVAANSEGNVYNRLEFITKPEAGYSEWLKKVSQSFSELKHITTDWVPETAGISVGGPADWENGILKQPPNLPGWVNVPVKSDIASVTGLKTQMEHDGRAGALAEYRFGAGRGFQNIVFLTFGTGIGAGIILGGKIYRGSDGFSGEIGHVRVSETGPDAYGKPGCLESFASGTGISRLATLRYPSKWPNYPSAKEVIILASTKDNEAILVLQESAEYLGKGMAIIADLLNPEIIILGSLSRHLPDWYLQKARKVMIKEALAGNTENLRVEKTILAERLQDLASVCVAIDVLNY